MNREDLMPFSDVNKKQLRAYKYDTN